MSAPDPRLEAAARAVCEMGDYIGADDPCRRSCPECRAHAARALLNDGGANE
jgi:hypothetical protein